MNRYSVILFLFTLSFWACKKNDDDAKPAGSLNFISEKIDGQSAGSPYYNVALSPLIKFRFSTTVNRSTVNKSISLKDKSGTNIGFSTTYENNDSTIVVQPSSPLSPIAKYSVIVSSILQSSAGSSLTGDVKIDFITRLDSARKFPVITDDSLLTLVQKQTFKYFWDFGHPVSGMARERNTSDNVVTTGGTGFGIMAIPVAVNRSFITRAEGLARTQKIVNFLKTTPPDFHGAFSHWMDGATGAVIPFAANDNGADLVETSFLMMGLLTARQYFNGGDASETALRNDINFLYNRVEWDWFRQGGKNVLFWNWSPQFNWAVNVPVQGWNETLITYVLAASSITHTIPKPVYDSGFARSGAMVNNKVFYGYKLPLGEDLGGPLFFEHYSFLGINPISLTDAYANYQVQTTNHTKINYEYCKANPKKYFGYSDSCWGLTASDIENGYTASSPTNDVGVIAPTAAISSLAYTPTESMKALKFFYYVLGDKIWGEYGFKDAFNLHTIWFANSYLAFDQGPIIVMIENYRTGLLWNLFMGCPEVKTGMLKLGFQSPHL